ncbi:MAG: tetratricopeptide repeat protein [Gammaproteobacteria bacterium]|nr:tetratricopeptide repeat protein [Gammaproteobacteria bacterium]MDH3505839.1 tetratricopeptide repeat protein [Gammaproteobacteria bacterium]
MPLTMGIPYKIIVAIVLAWLASCATTGLPERGDRRADLDSYVLLAELAREREQFVEAAEHYLAAAMISEEPRLAGIAAEMAHQLELNDIGLAAAQRWREVDPNDPRSNQFLGLFLLRGGDLEGAVTVFEELLETARNEAAGLALIIEAIFDEADDAAVMALVARLVENHPDVAEGHFGLARLAMRVDEFELAVQSARRAAELRPAWIEAQLLVARLLVLTGRAEEGLALIESLATENAELEVQLQYAELLLSAGHADTARERLDEILTTNPGLPEAIRALAFLTLTQNDLEASQGYFEQLRAQPRFREEAFYYLGRIAETEEQPLQALRSYSRVTSGSNVVEAQLRAANVLYTQLGDQEGALQHLREFGLGNPDYEIEMLVSQSDLLLRMERHDEASAVITEALERHAENRILEQAQLQIYIVRAQAAVGRDELDLADDLLREGLRLYPDDLSLRYAQALLYQEQGRLRRAASALEAIIADTPEDAGLLNALGYLLTDSLDRHDEAYGYIEQALMLEPDNAAIIDSMGWVLFHLGDYDAALEHLQRAFELFPDPEVAAHIIEVYWAMGREAEARSLLERELASHPDSDFLLDVSKRLGP